MQSLGVVRLRAALLFGQCGNKGGLGDRVHRRVGKIKTPAHSSDLPVPRQPPPFQPSFLRPSSRKGCIRVPGGKAAGIDQPQNSNSKSLYCTALEVCCPSRCVMIPISEGLPSVSDQVTTTWPLTIPCN